ncbi:cupredoxin domain-containing protein [Cohnella silvisoli]|uniref:Plastocyanin/azurin family copper-binding protein n=1 Tax=Cohnella silvisoli TaxID=2873699 RepID=A0ABV1KPH8_9BACL|nr:cupredoxin family copper-binding protein [Cohnella silvisoli]MCD9020968.1 cupredoxin domain-containing protein [Cohnella silvisoli]
MRIQLKNCLYALMLAIMIIALAACSSSTKEDQATASNTPYNETSQAPSESVAPSSESASASPATPSASASSSPSESASTEPSAQPSKEGGTKESASPSPSAEESHEHEATPKPSASKPSPEPSAPKPSPEPSKKPEQGEAEAADKTTIVEIKDFTFSPDKVTIRKGGTVKFINRDKVKHTATADGGEFDTGLIGKDVAGEVKFDETGTFSYFCSPHPGMTGTIVVEDN